MRFDRLERILLPYEKILRAQERFRGRIGVREVDRPTYEKYIIGPIKRFDPLKNAFKVLQTDYAYGEEFRTKFKKRTGYDDWTTPLPYHELEPEDRIGQSLAKAGWRLCQDYHPDNLPVTPLEGRVEVNDRAWMSRLIKKVGLMFGADRIHITKVDQRWVYEGIDIPHKYAIMVVVQHKPTLINTAPSHFSWASATDAYSRLKYITTQLSDFIRGLGYPAQYRETLGWGPEMLVVPMAIDAGIGEFARTCRVLSPEYGINMRIKPVTTDLPLQVDRPISFGVHEFCMACESCATFCPSNAVPYGEPAEEPPDPLFNNPGYRKWYLRADRCLIFWAANKKKWLSCGGRCIAVCPWNKKQSFFHNMVRWMAIRAPAFIKKLLVWADIKAYGRRKSIKNSYFEEA
jgi:epoxyqueuosine reductase